MAPLGILDDSARKGWADKGYSLCKARFDWTALTTELHCIGPVKFVQLDDVGNA